MATIRSMRAVENYLKIYPDKDFTKGFLREELNIDFNSLGDIFDYLVKEKKVTSETRGNKKVLYKWNK